VQGTINGTASVDGQQYRALDAAKVAHTFTIPQLGLNVPIPGDAPNNANYLTVTFSFRTGGSGTYTFQCFAPCGTGNGFDGPMASMAYMKGTLTVQG
jgi:heme/copper-type cytochrome/quinol oxidase subunit 2